MCVYSLKNVYWNIVDRFTHFKECVDAIFKIGILTKVHAQTAFAIDRPHYVDPTAKSYTRNSNATAHAMNESRPGKLLTLNSMDMQLNHKRG